MNNILDLLLISAITSLQITFIHVLFFDGMLLQKLRPEWIAAWLKKPVYDCLICMTSVWGVILWVTEWNMAVNLLWFLFTVGGINVLISGIIGVVEDYTGEMFVKENFYKEQEHNLN